MRALIVEDELITARDIEISLTHLGYVVTAVVTSGEEALAHLVQEKADFVIMDINLKGKMNGIEAANCINKSYHIPVIFLTALSDRATIEKVKMSRPYGYLVKPFNEDDIKVAVEIALHRFSLDREAVLKEATLHQSISQVEEAIIVVKQDYTVELINAQATQILGKILSSKENYVHINSLIEFYNLNEERVSCNYYLNLTQDIAKEYGVCRFPFSQRVEKLLLRVSRIFLEDQFVGWTLILSCQEMKSEAMKSLIQDTKTTSTHKSFIFAKKGKKHVRVPLSDILWFEATDDYVIIHTLQEKFLAYITLKELDEKLPSEDFMKIHRSYIVRLDKINYIEEGFINIYGKALPISKSFKKILKQRLLFV